MYVHTYVLYVHIYVRLATGTNVCLCMYVFMYVRMYSIHMWAHVRMYVHMNYSMVIVQP